MLSFSDWTWVIHDVFDIDPKSVLASIGRLVRHTRVSHVLTSSLAVNATAPVKHELAPFRFDALPLGAIRASGWLEDQTRLSANGLGGHLQKFYRYVERSSWVGGDQEYSDLNEGAPYWFNYIVPMAAVLDDDALKLQSKQFVDYVIDNQQHDGWIGPEKTRQARGIWARSLFLFGFTQYAQAFPSEKQRVTDAMHRYVVLAHSMLKKNFTGLITNDSEGDYFDPGGFGIARAHEFPVSLMWLYEQDPRENAELIWETMELMFEGAVIAGMDWTDFFVKGRFPEVGTPHIPHHIFQHGVNLAQGLRYPSTLYRLTGNDSLLQQAHDAVDMTLKYHTALSGTIIADEQIGGRSAQRGSELCMAVESVFSYAWLYRFHGTNLFADRAELTAFNAFPAGVSSDWWAHNYVTQTNQPWIKNLTDNPFSNVNSYGNVLGLEPDYPCCTVNHPQGYPKYIASSFVRDGEDAIAHILLGPGSVQSTIRDANVLVTCNTNYPFSSSLNYTISSEVDFTFKVRVPAWAVRERSHFKVGTANVRRFTPDATTGLHSIPIKKGDTELNIFLAMDVQTVERDGSIAFYRGPLLYAADISFNQTAHDPLQYRPMIPLPGSETLEQTKDYYLEPTSEWRFAVDPSTVQVREERKEGEILPKLLFTSDGPPTSLAVDAYVIDWPLDHGTAAEPPLNPIVSKATKTTIRLVPFGAAKLHIAQFPIARFA